MNSDDQPGNNDTTEEMEEVRDVGFGPETRRQRRTRRIRLVLACVALFVLAVATVVYFLDSAGALS